MRKALAVICVSLAMAAVVAAQQRTLTAQDYAEIQQLYAQFSHALDTGANNGNAYAQLFTADGSYMDETGKTITGRDSLAAYARGAGKTATSIRTFIYNTWIEPTSATAANGKAYVVMATVNETGQPASVQNGGQFHDVLVKTAEGWRIRERKFVRAVAGNAPAAQPAAPAQPGRGGRGQ